MCISITLVNYRISELRTNSYKLKKPVNGRKENVYITLDKVYTLHFNKSDQPHFDIALDEGKRTFFFFCPKVPATSRYQEKEKARKPSVSRNNVG